MRIAAGILIIIGGVLLYTIMRAFGFGGFLGTFLMIALAAGGVIVMRKTLNIDRVRNVFKNT